SGAASGRSSDRRCRLRRSRCPSAPCSLPRGREAAAVDVSRRSQPTDAARPGRSVTPGSCDQPAAELNWWVVATERAGVLQPLSMRDPETVLREFCTAWRLRDLDALLAWFAADAVYHNMPIVPVRGHAEIRGVLEMFVPPASKIEFEILAVASSGDVVFTERVDRFVVGG